MSRIDSNVRLQLSHLSYLSCRAPLCPFGSMFCRAGRGAAFHIELPVSPIPGITTARKPKGTGHFGVDKVRALLRPRLFPPLFPRCESFSFTSFSLFASIVCVF